LCVKLLNAKDIDKEKFPVYGGKCLSRKAVHNWVEKFSQGRSKVADDARSDAGVTGTTVKNFHVGVFGASLKRWGKCISVGGGYIEK
jgi:hypothetical protein